MLEQFGVPSTDSNLEKDRSSFRELMLTKYGKHDGIWISFDHINGLGLGNPRFSNVYYLLDLPATAPKIDLNVGNFPHRNEDYDNVPPLLQEVLLGNQDPYFPRENERDGTSSIRVFDVKKMGTFPQRNKNREVIGEPQPYDVLSVVIPTDINQKDLEKLLTI